MKKLKTKTYFDGEGNNPPPSPPPPPAPTVKTFTQEQVDKLMADHRKGLQEANRQQAEELQKLRDKANLTQAERDELDARIQQLATQHQTEAQRAAAEYQSLKKKYETDTAKLTEASTVSQRRFEELLTKQAIATGCLTHKALSAEQMTMMLLPQAKVYPVLGENNEPTGEFVAKVKLTVPDAKDKKKMVTVELPIVEAIQKMKEMEAYANLFEQTGRGGLGGSNGTSVGSGGTVDWSKLTPEQHRELRKKTK